VAFDLKNLAHPLNVHTVSGNMFSAPPTLTDRQALDWARGEVEKALTEQSGFLGSSGWSNGTGTFFGLTDPLKVVAAVPGQDYFGTPAVHLVYEANEAVESYVEFATITAEFAEEAIELIKADGSCFVSWSG
jgi:hypothetical protein